VKGSRLLVLVLVAAAVVALVWSFDGRPAATGEGLEAPVVPAAGEPDSLSSTWFCAAGGVATQATPRHDLFLWNPAGETVTALLTAYNADGEVGEQQVEVTSPGPTEVDVNALFGANGLSVMVESGAGELVVEHRIITPTVADQVPCATSSSDRWYFPAQTSVRNTTAQLYLFNPFQEDASVDISATIADGVREPPEWQGLVVPAGTARLIDLGSGAQRREQFAVSVEARNGQVVAETSQLLATPRASADIPATRGLRLQVGVPRASADWVFAEGFTGPGASERLVLFNPGEQPATALVQVTPFGAAELPPEPFEIEVPARRFAQLDLSAETRIPPEGLHAIRVETDEDTPLVAGRVVTVFAGREDPSAAEIVARPPVSLGTSIGTGSPDAAALWATTGVVVGERQESVIAVHNPSLDTVRVTATVLGGEADGKVLADAVEVAPGDSLAVRTRDQGLGGNEVTVVVEATAPVVVERTITYLNQNDFSMGLAVPLPSDRLRLTPVGQ
jgi:hypothetical protein